MTYKSLIVNLGAIGDFVTVLPAMISIAPQWVAESVQMLLSSPGTDWCVHNS